MIIPKNTVKRRPAAKTGKVSAEVANAPVQATEAQEQPATATVAVTEPVIVPAAVPESKTTRKSR